MNRSGILPLIALCSLAAGGAAIQADNGKTRPDIDPKQKPTYAETVAPILNRSCIPCHHDGGVAPFSLVGYENAKKWSSNIVAVTQAKAMPPWKAAAGYGEFLDDPHLSNDEIALLGRWHEAGAPRGNAAKEPAAPEFKSSWPLGEPDLILKPERSYRLDSEGDDVYRNFVLKNTFDAPVWVKAMAVKPGNSKVVHHAIVFIDGSDSAKNLEDANKDGQIGYSSNGTGVGFFPSGTLGGWAPGVTTRNTPPGIAFKVKSGSTLVLQVHYHKSGKSEEDLTQLGLYYAKEPIQTEMKLDWIFNFGINIPAGEKTHREVKVRNVPADVTIYGAMPHMHLLGRSMKAEVEFPDGTVKPLVWVDDWDFNWQLQYALKEPMKVPKGSKIRVEAVYDNSSDNPRNPSNPPKTVTWGEQTTDEMFLLIVAHTVDVSAATEGR